MNQTPQHASLAAGRWTTLSLAEQLGNVGSEVHRALRARGDAARFEVAIFRGLELLDLTLADLRWRERRKELARARELLCGAFFGSMEYETSLEDLNAYFFQFACAAHAGR